MGKITKYKVGDNVLFTFLGEHIKGTITEKIDNFQFRVNVNEALLISYIKKLINISVIINY